MFSKTHIRFNSNIGNQKPESIINRDTTCPFCDVQNLEDILAQDGDILLVKNKYAVLENAFQTVLIESDDCDGDVSTYSKEHLYRLMQFGLHHWKVMRESGEYKSVLFYKNFGPHSGGSIHHPHMQIVGLQDVDYHENVKDEDFEGIPMIDTNALTFNVSTKPRVGFFEFNVILREKRAWRPMSDLIQVAAHYSLHHFHRSCNSYNLFFYDLANTLVCKIMPRFVTSPLYVGYALPQVSNRIGEVAGQIQDIYNLRNFTL